MWNGEAWFMSVLVIFWMLLRPITSKVRNLSLKFSSALLLLCCIWPIATYWVPLIEGDSGSAQNAIIAIIVRASPAGYFHVFIAGILSARIFILSATSASESTGRITLDTGSVPLLMKYGCCLGYLIWAMIIIFDAPPLYLFMHQGGLIPIMFLIIMGAAVGVDP